jgi:hypothetical protein
MVRRAAEASQWGDNKLRTKPACLNKRKSYKICKHETTEDGERIAVTVAVARVVGEAITY